MGIPSNPLNVQTCTYPNQPAAVAVIGTITPVYIVIGWTLLTTHDYDTGRSPVTNYSLIWQDTTDSTSSVELYYGDATTDQYNVTSGFLINKNYSAQVAAINDVGKGAYSPVTVILTCDVPTRMNTPTEDPLTNAT